MRAASYIVFIMRLTIRVDGRFSRLRRCLKLGPIRRQQHVRGLRRAGELQSLESNGEAAARLIYFQDTARQRLVMLDQMWFGSGACVDGRRQMMPTPLRTLTLGGSEDMLATVMHHVLGLKARVAVSLLVRKESHILSVIF